MSTERAGGSHDGIVVAIIVRCYPPSWRRRYEPEFRATLADVGPTPATVLNALAGALSAWVTPSVGLTRVQRVRTTLSVVWSAWVALVGGLLFFAQMTEDAPFKAANAAIAPLGFLYDTCVAAGAISALALAVGATPIVTRTVSRAVRRRDSRAAALVAAPVCAPLLFLGVLVGAARIWRHGGPPFFGVVVVVACAIVAAIVSAWAPGSLLRNTELGARAYRNATLAAVPMIGAVTLSWLASVAYAITLRSDAPRLEASVSLPVPLFVYVFAMGLAASVAAVSLRRGLLALRRAETPST